jgi:hypothetical protein
MSNIAQTRAAARFLGFMDAQMAAGRVREVVSEALVIRGERAAPRLGRVHLVKALKRVCQLPLPGGFFPSPVE